MRAGGYILVDGDWAVPAVTRCTQQVWPAQSVRREPEGNETHTIGGSEYGQRARVSKMQAASADSEPKI